MRSLEQLRMLDVMTKAPRCIEPHQTVELARQWMDDLKVRHLPVRESGKVVGIVSDRDLALFMGLAKSGKEPVGRRVEDAMLSEVLTVAETDALETVAAKMLTHRVGSAVVIDRNGAVTGIFTDTDALRILSGGR